MSYLVLDTETTGLDAEDELLEIAVIDQARTVLLHTYVRPVRHSRWPAAEAIHSISPRFIFAGDSSGKPYPTWQEVKPELLSLCRGREVVLYNASFDCMHVGEALVESTVRCAMLRFAGHYGDWHEYYQDYRWQSLDTAADYVLHQWTGRPHQALADCLATRDVWEYLISPERQAVVEETKHQRALQERERQQVEQFLANLQQQENQYWNKLSVRKTQELFDRLGLPFQAWEHWNGKDAGVSLLVGKAARESAAVYCPLITGYQLSIWEEYGDRLHLPIYEQEEDIPLHLRWPHERIHWLKDKPLPVALRKITPAKRNSTYQSIRYVNLYDWYQLELGRDWVPVVRDYPENTYSQSRLRKEFKLKDQDIARLRPVAFRSTKYLDYYLYQYPCGT